MQLKSEGLSFARSDIWRDREQICVCKKEEGVGEERIRSLGLTDANDCI